GAYDSSDMVPLLEAIFLGLHFRDWLTENEQTRLSQFAPPAGYTVMTFGDRVLFPRELLPEVLESTSQASVHGSDAIFTHRCCIHDRDLVSGVVHTARIGAIGTRDLMLSVCQPDHDKERQRQIEQFGKFVAAVRTAFRSASEATAVLRSRLPAKNPHILVNRASGRVVTAHEDICRELGSDSEQLADVEYSQLAERLRGFIHTRVTRMENIAIGDMNLAVVTFLPERRRKSDFGNPIDMAHLVDAMRNKVASIVTASSYLENLYNPANTNDRNEMAAIILSHADELTRMINSLESKTAVGNDSSEPRLSAETIHRSRFQEAIPDEKHQQGDDKLCLKP
ncbi:MAG: hypothetical protein NTW07_02140, partial [candidate division Zixibacteria bacterium]|nr:hypothetical protein [candidate division Zixibacteria bacterium]